jgi:hypothetical protein
MQDSFFRRVRGVLFGVAPVLCFSYAALAETSFMVQLGSFESEADARKHWEKVEERFPDLFEPLHFSSAKIQMPPDDVVYYRTQAGPVAARREAEEICAKLTPKGFECLVAETAMFTEEGKPLAEELEEAVANAPTEAPPPPAAPVADAPQAAGEEVDVMEAVESGDITAMYSDAAPEQEQKQAAMKNAPEPAPAPLPAPKKAAVLPPPPPLAVTSPPPAPPVSGGTPFHQGQSPHAGSAASLPWLSSSAPTPAPVALPPAMTPVVAGEHADLKVAEAVPVPLSALAPATPVYRTGGALAPRRAYPSQPVRAAALWAELSYFISQDAALGYWRVLRSRDAALPDGVRLRVVRPLRQATGAQRLSLRVGPFNDTTVIRRLCAQTAPERLRCQAIRDIGTSIAYGGQGQGLTRQRLAPGERLERRGRIAASPFASSSFGALGGGAYWVQLGAFPSPEAARQQWASLKFSAAGVFAGAREQIMTPAYSSAARPLYRLRAGPFTQSMDAIRACETLKNRGNSCVVVTGR